VASCSQPRHTSVELVRGSSQLSDSAEPARQRELEPLSSRLETAHRRASERLRGREACHADEVRRLEDSGSRRPHPRRCLCVHDGACLEAERPITGSQAK